MAQPFYLDDMRKLEIGVDEVGRGPMFGRVYTAAVILPKEDFDYSLMKDSKKFTSEKKINAAAEYIKKNALYWAISYEDEKVIDKFNIRQATFKSMHKSIASILEQIGEKQKKEDIFLLIDGTDFKPYTKMIDETLYAYNHECVKGGDNEYASISGSINGNANGIMGRDIPAGQEDLYVLKSQIVPPVCPACPVIREQKKCAPCPPCGRCPEEKFSCKKVPNYKSMDPSRLPALVNSRPDIL